MTSGSTSSTQAFGAAIATILLWAGAFPATAIAVRHVDPIGLAAVRFAAAGSIMLVWMLWQRAWPRAWADFLRVVGCAFLGIALYNVLLNSGQQTVSPGAASFIVATQPVYAAMLSYLLTKERFGVQAALGTVVALGGVGIISLVQGGTFQWSEGMVLVLGAAMCSGTYFVVQRPLVLRHGALRSAAWTLVFGAILLLPWLPSGAIQVAASGEAIAATLFLAMGPAVLGYMFWMRALAGLGAARAANLLFLMAPLATILSLPLKDHPLEMQTIVGGLIALVGVAIANRGFASARA